MNGEREVKIFALIRRNADGAETRYMRTWVLPDRTNNESDVDDLIVRIWCKGELKCDCNRNDLFNRSDADNIPCSEGLYSVRVYRVDGVEKLLYAEYGPDVSDRYLEKEAERIKALKRGGSE